MAQESFFDGILRSLAKNQGRAAVIIVLTLLVTVLVNSYYPPVYESTALVRIMISEGDARAGLAESINGLLAQRNIINDVLKSCGINLGNIVTTNPFRIEDAGPDLVRITVRHHNPNEIDKIGASLIKTLSEQFLGFSSEMVSFEIESLEKKRGVILGKIREARSQWAISNLEPHQLEEQDDSLSLLDEEIQIVQGELDSLNTQLRTIPRVQVVASAEMNSRYKKAQAELRKVRNNLARLLKNYREKHPRVIEANGAIRKIESEIKSISPRRDSRVPNPEHLAVQTQVEEKDRRLGELRDRANQLRALISGAGDNPLSSNAMMVRLQNLEEIYNDILKRIEQINLKHSASHGRIQVLKGHSIPTDPSGLSGLQRSFLGMTCGLLVSMLLLYTPNPIRTEIVIPPEGLMACGMGIEGDGRFIHRILQIPALYNERLALPEPDQEAGPMLYDERLVALNQPGSPILEPLKALRSNLQVAISEANTRIIIVSSSRAGTGRTTISANLGVLLAQSGYSVVLVDANLRKPSLHKVFDLDGSKGLSDLLCRKGSTSCVQQTLVKNLGVLPAGPIPPNPAEMLGSVAMIELLESLKRRVELVIIDTPGLLDHPDAGILAGNAGAVVFLNKEGEPENDMIASRDFLNRIRANVLGYITI